MDCNGCDSTCKAGWLGHMGCLKRLLKGGAKWSPQTSTNIAVHGDLDCLEFAYNNGCPLDDGMCTDAAFNGHVGCLAFAHGHGVPLDKGVCSAAAVFKSLDCIMYAYVHRAPGAAQFERLILGFVNARKHRAATHIQRWWIDRLYKPAGPLYARSAASFLAAQLLHPPARPCCCD